MKKKKIIITGSAGLVGLNLISLINKSYSQLYNVIAIDQNKHNINLTKQIFPKITAITADVTKPGKWQNLFQNADCVIQLQAQISHPKKNLYVKNNITSVKNVLTLCKKYKIPNLIHISSSVVISVANDNYTNTKRKGEELVTKSKIPHTILRPTLMYGCFDIKHLGFLTKVIDLSPIFPIPGSGKYIRQPVFVLDMCQGIINLIEREATNKIYNIVGKEKIYFIDLMKIIAKEKKKKRLFIPIPTPIFLFLLKVHSLLTGKNPFISAQLAALQNNDVFPESDWNKELKVKPTKFQKSMKQTVNSPYYKYRKQMKKFED